MRCSHDFLWKLEVELLFLVHVTDNQPQGLLISQRDSFLWERQRNFLHLRCQYDQNMMLIPHQSSMQQASDCWPRSYAMGLLPKLASTLDHTTMRKGFELAWM